MPHLLRQHTQKQKKKKTLANTNDLRLNFVEGRFLYTLERTRAERNSVGLLHWPEHDAPSISVTSQSQKGTNGTRKPIVVVSPSKAFDHHEPPTVSSLKKFWNKFFWA